MPERKSTAEVVQKMLKEIQSNPKSQSAGPQEADDLRRREVSPTGGGKREPAKSKHLPLGK